MVIFLARLYKFKKSYFSHPGRPCHSKVLYASFSEIHIWASIGTLEGRLSFHDSWPQGPCPRMELEVKKIFCFPVMQMIYRDTWSFISKPYNIDLCVMKWRSPWPCHEVKVTLTYFSRSSDFTYLEDFDGWTSNFWNMSQCDTTFVLKINEGHSDLCFMVQWFSLISWRLFDGWTSNFWIISQRDTTFDLKINVGHSDLYFMVQWFCLISRSLFNGCDVMIGLIINVSHSDLYFMDQWFCFIEVQSQWCLPPFLCTQIIFVLLAKRDFVVLRQLLLLIVNQADTAVNIHFCMAGNRSTAQVQKIMASITPYL